MDRKKKRKKKKKKKKRKKDRDSRNTYSLRSKQGEGSDVNLADKS